MARITKVERMCFVRRMSKQQARDFMECIVIDMCFGILKPLSDFIYSHGGIDKKTLFGTYCNTIFNTVKEDVKEASKATSAEEFRDKVLKNVLILQNDMIPGMEANDLLDSSQMVVQELEAFQERYKEIYSRFFKYKKRGRKKNES